LENCKLTHKAEIDKQYKIFISMLYFIEDNQRKQETFGSSESLFFSENLRRFSEIVKRIKN
jgi:hypothetical protein